MRKERKIDIEDNGTLHHFVIRQMSASKMEDWLIRAIPVVAPVFGGTTLDDIGEAIAKADLSMLQHLNVKEGKPLLDEILGCASRIVNGAEYPVTTDDIDGYFTSIKSLFRLRVECFKVNFDFFLKENGSQSQDGEGSKAAGSSNIRISRNSKAS